MDALSNAVSGITVSQLQADIAANNVANLNTPGFRPSGVAQAARPAGGVTANVVPGQAPPSLSGVPASGQPSGTDEITELAAMVTAPIAYAANARVVSTSTAMTGGLLDVFA